MPRPVPSVLTPDAPDHLYAGQINRLTGLLHGDVPPGLPLPGAIRTSLNFARQDYLGLASHPMVQAPTDLKDAAPDHQAIALIEARLAAAVKLPGAVTFPSGAEAIHQTLSALLTPQDHVLVDSAAPLSLFEAICASGADLHRFPNGSIEAVERRLLRLATQPGRVVIAVPALSPNGSKVWDLAELSALAQSKGALLVVDASHDLGLMGQDGGGVMEVQGCLGRANIVLGSLDACFGAAGGFAALRDTGLLGTLRRRAQPLPPMNAQAILAATTIAFSAEGSQRRRLLHRLSLRLRNHLMADGACVLGKASPLVPILLPAASALHRTAMLESAGPRVTLLQAPTVPRLAPRWRVELSALHSLADIDDLAELIRDVTRAFDRAPVRLPVAV